MPVASSALPMPDHAYLLRVWHACARTICPRHLFWSHLPSGTIENITGDMAQVALDALPHSRPHHGLGVGPSDVAMMVFCKRKSAWQSMA